MEVRGTMGNEQKFSNPAHGPLEWDYFVGVLCMRSRALINHPKFVNKSTASSQTHPSFAFHLQFIRIIFGDADMSLSRPSSSASFVPLWDSSDPGNSPSTGPRSLRNVY